MSEPALIFAIPSKGRLQEQTIAWLDDAGFALRRVGGERGYAAALSGLPAIDVRLLSAQDIAQSLDAGAIHLGVTGEDLIQETSADPIGRIHAFKALGFGRCDVVVAAPSAWIDVVDLADLEDVAARERSRTGRQLRVATKYARLTRRFFAAKGLADYRIVESLGATEGAPAAGAADVIVDITTSGRTLAANHLKPLVDGVILKSEAKLYAAVRAPWPPEAIEAARLLVEITEARAQAKAAVRVSATVAPELIVTVAEAVGGAPAPEGRGFLCAASKAGEAGARLRAAGGADVVVEPLTFWFRGEAARFGDFIDRLKMTGS